MPDTSKLEKLNWELEKSEKKLRKAINDETDSGNPSEKTMDGFVEVTEQMELPF